MSVNDNFKNLIAKFRPRTSKQTRISYFSSLKNIAKGTGLDFNEPYDFVKHYDAVMKYLMTLKTNVRKTKLASVVVILQDPDYNDVEDEELDEVLAKYNMQMYMDAREVAKEEKEQKFSKKKEDNYISWAEVEKIYANLKKETDHLWDPTLRLCKSQFFRLQDFVILSVYILIPPRRSKDYTKFKIHNIDKKTDNYMEVPQRKKKQSKFVFNDYKNASRLGTEFVDIPFSLKKIIDKWTKINPFDYLIVNTKFEEMVVQSLTRILNRLFEREISTTMLRNIYLTSIFEHVDLKDLEESAHNMGNNQITRILKYVKKAPKEE